MPTLERRFHPGRVEFRDGDGQRAPLIRGHASVYNEWYTLLDIPSVVIRERILPGAFNNALLEKQDVRALFNHDPTLILGRTKAGTLRLSLDSTGLVYEVDPPDTQVGRDLITSLRRGDVDGSSFGFTIRRGGQTVTRRDDAETGKRIVERDVTDVDLFDVSPVTYPAYRGTDSEVRGISPAHCEFVDEILALEAARSRSKAADVLREKRLRLAMFPDRAHE